MPGSGQSRSLTDHSESQEAVTRTEATRNVVLFGECGVGKSSVINAIIGLPVAETSNDIVGCTDENACYTVALDTEMKLNIWDTIGLDEGTAGKIPADEAKQHLKQFLQKRMEDAEGVDLLLYCIRGASGKKRLPVKKSHWDKYQFVFEEVCKNRLPIALIVTHLESYNPGGDMDAWWNVNEEIISEFGFQFCAHACITTYSEADADDGRIEGSRRRLKDLLSHHYLAPRNVLLLGDREDRDDFVDTIAASRKKHDSEGVSSLTRIPVAFGAHTHINFWNTNGFSRADDDVLITEKNMRSLVQDMKHTGGIDLLLFCFRAGRPKFRHIQSYNLFHAAVCRKKVSVAIAILGPAEVADTWWQKNEQDLRQRGLRFDRHVYVPCDPCQRPTGDLNPTTCHQLIQLVQEERSLGRWMIGNDALWMTVPNVRAVVGELSWPTTVVIVCDTTKQGALGHIVPHLQSALQHPVTSANPLREYRFQQVDPQTLLPILSQTLDHVQHRISDKRSRGIGLLVFFISAARSDSETWRTLEKFYAIYKGNITPCIVVVYGVAEKRLAEDFWRTAPGRIKRRIGTYLTYHPGSDALPEAQAVAQDVMVNMIQDRCLVDLGEKIGVLQEILSVWRRYRSQRHASDRVSI